MNSTLMNLKILLPFQIFAEKKGVSRIVAETREGSFGLLPHRLDCVAALEPGILIYETEAEGRGLCGSRRRRTDQDRSGCAGLCTQRHLSEQTSAN